MTRPLSPRRQGGAEGRIVGVFNTCWRAGRAAERQGGGYYMALQTYYDPERVTSLPGKNPRAAKKKFFGKIF